MERIIDIDLFEEKDLLEQYNRKKVSRNLINYLVESSYHFSKSDIVKLIINSKLNKSSKELIIEGLKNEYAKSLRIRRNNNIKQLIYLIIGIIILFVSTLIHDQVFSEVVLIGGWVFIWAMVELEIFSDIDGRKRRKILKKLLYSEIIENKIESK